MSKKINCILLIDDNPDDNILHKRVIIKSNVANAVISMGSGMEALEFRGDQRHKDYIFPDLILLDIHMPIMTGWEFLDAYDRFHSEQKTRVIVVMLTPSSQPEDLQKAKMENIVDDLSLSR